MKVVWQSDIGQKLYIQYDVVYLNKVDQAIFNYTSIPMISGKIYWKKLENRKNRTILGEKLIIRKKPIINADTTWDYLYFHF